MFLNYMFNRGTLCHMLAKSGHFVQRLYIYDFFIRIREKLYGRKHFKWSFLDHVDTETQ